ncbi:hypothetical protein BGY98DRAFT_967758 [Russula aff. rugulosa BPL654]|nr:hypothetical protein BGY98DRAFT_967758 [Russula aff. rugulosa BPL654]
MQLSQTLSRSFPLHYGTPLGRTRSREYSNQLRSCPFSGGHYSSLIRTHVFDTLCGRFLCPAVKACFNRNQNMPCIRFRVDNKAPSLAIRFCMQHLVGLRTGSNAVSASQANSFYSLRLGQLGYLVHFLIVSCTARAHHFRFVATRQSHRASMTGA